MEQYRNGGSTRKNVVIPLLSSPLKWIFLATVSPCILLMSRLLRVATTDETRIHEIQDLSSTPTINDAPINTNKHFDTHHPNPTQSSSSTSSTTTSYQRTNSLINTFRNHHPAHGKLQFLHIPKTAGSAIEVLAIHNNITWGACHFTTQVFEYSCPKKNEKSAVVGHTWKGPTSKDDWVGVNYWHLPIQYFSDHPYYEGGGDSSNHTTTTKTTNSAAVAYANSNSNAPFVQNPYKNATIFTIVRNPYNRLISEYYMRKASGKSQHYRTIQHHPTKLNKFVSNAITKSMNSIVGSPTYFRLDGHLIPQYHYIYNITHNDQKNSTTDNNDNNDDPLVDHVLRFEDLPYSLYQLLQLEENSMDSWNLSSFFCPINVGSRQTKQHHLVLVPENFTQATLDLIHSYYGRDFIEFGYETINH